MLFKRSTIAILCIVASVSCAFGESDGPARCPEGYFDSVCQDVSRSCALYTKGGFCSMGHFQKMCKSSCGLCGQNEAPVCQKCGECSGWSSIPVVPCGYKNGDVGCAVCGYNEHLYAEFNSGNNPFPPPSPKKGGGAQITAVQLSQHSTMHCRKPAGLHVQQYSS